MTLRIGSVCTGYGGLDLAVQEVLGGELAWVADNDPGAARILAHRFPDVPNLGDITETDWAAVGPVDLICAGFPCQDVSCAGARAGLREGNRTGVWSHVASAIRTLRPALVVLENVGGLLSESADSDMEPCPWCLGDADPESAMRALGAVLADLAEAGFDADWLCVRASDVGAPHKRERVFITAWPAADTERNAAGGLDGGVARDIPARGQARPHPERSPAQDPDGATGSERRQPAPGQAPGGRSRADAGGPGGAPAADAERDGLEGQRSDAGPGAGWPAEAPGGLRPVRGDSPAADAEVRGRPGGVQHAGEQGPAGTWHQAQGNPRRGDLPDADAIAWGSYGPAIRRWEAALGRPAPRPVEPGRTGERLSPAFVEFLMGIPEGWVTDVPGLSRNAQLKALGNGVVPQQAALALRLLLGVSADALCA